MPSPIRFTGISSTCHSLGDGAGRRLATFGILLLLSFLLRERPMREHKCPSCENDISDVVTSAIVSRLTAGESESDVVTCPHCGTELSLTVNIDASLSRLS